MEAFDQEYIIAYLQEELSEEDRKSFEKVLKTDKALQQELALQQSILDSIDQQGDLLMKERLSKVVPKYQAPIKSKPFATRRIIRWLLPLTGVVLALVFLLPNLWNSSKTAQDLFDGYYQAYPLNFATRTNDPDTKLLNAANQAYQEKNYQDAINHLSQIISEDKDGKYRLAIGICALETKQYQLAIDSFLSLITPADPVYETHAMWYTAMAYLQLEKLDQAKSYLQKISDNPKAFKHLEAKELLHHSLLAK